MRLWIALLADTILLLFSLFHSLLFSICIIFETIKGWRNTHSCKNTFTHFWNKQIVGQIYIVSCSNRSRNKILVKNAKNKVTRLALMNSKLTQSLSMHNLAASFHSDTSGEYNWEVGGVLKFLMTLVKMMVMVTNVLMSFLRVNSTPVPLLLPLQLPALPQPGLHPWLDLLVRHLVHLGPAQLHGAVGDPEPQPAATQLQPLKRRRKICDTIKEEKAHSKDSLGWKGTQSQPIPCPVKYMWARFSSSFAKSSSTQVNPTNGTILFARRINFPKKSSNYKRSVLLDCIFFTKTLSDVFKFLNDTVQSLSVVFRTTITVRMWKISVVTNDANSKMGEKTSFLTSHSSYSNINWQYFPELRFKQLLSMSLSSTRNRQYFWNLN